MGFGVQIKGKEVWSKIKGAIFGGERCTNILLAQNQRKAHVNNDSEVSIGFPCCNKKAAWPIIDSNKILR